MVFIIGVDHLVQYKGPVPEKVRDEFRSYIERICLERQIRVIAEEFSEEALREVYHATEETALEAARVLGIEHRYCDPGEKELRRLGIPYFRELLDAAVEKYSAPPSYIMDSEIRRKVRSSAAEAARSYWRIREEYWYSQLLDILDLNILFICGHEHAERFMTLLAEYGHRCAIIDRFWKEDMFRDYQNIGLI